MNRLRLTNGKHCKALWGWRCSSDAWLFPDRVHDIYMAGSRSTPDSMAVRLHYLTLIVGDLSGAYNDIGIRVGSIGHASA